MVENVLSKTDSCNYMTNLHISQFIRVYNAHYYRCVLKQDFFEKIVGENRIVFVLRKNDRMKNQAKVLNRDLIAID